MKSSRRTINMALRRRSERRSPRRPSSAIFVSRSRRRSSSLLTDWHGGGMTHPLIAVGVDRGPCPDGSDDISGAGRQSDRASRSDRASGGSERCGRDRQCHERGVRHRYRSARGKQASPRAPDSRSLRTSVRRLRHPSGDARSSRAKQERGSMRFSRDRRRRRCRARRRHHGLQRRAADRRAPARGVRRRLELPMRSRDLRSRGRLELAHVWHGREHRRSEQRWAGDCGVTREHAGAGPVRGDGRVYRIASDTSGASCSGTVTVLCSA